MKTSELNGAALDWAVAKCKYPELVWGSSIGIHHASHQIVIPHLPEPQCYWNPSTNWAQGGPIIEREHISIEATRVGGLGDRWMASDMGDCTEFADAPLIAAMRCFVASKLGDTVEIPGELC